MAESVPNELLIGHRMNADKAFADRLLESPFSRTEWDLIMSIVSFEIDHPEDPDRANLHPVVDDLESALAAAKEVPKEDSRGPYSSGDSSGDGIFDRFSGLFSTGPSDGERRRDAEDLINEYTATLQGQLEERSVWTDVCEATIERS